MQRECGAGERADEDRELRGHRAAERALRGLRGERAAAQRAGKRERADDGRMAKRGGSRKGGSNVFHEGRSLRVKGVGCWAPSVPRTVLAP